MRTPALHAIDRRLMGGGCGSCNTAITDRLAFLILRGSKAFLPCGIGRVTPAEPLFRADR